ncbi:hypothetical protein B0H34DRAFT_707064, partial [Crassisporium funariophilum]
MNDDGFRDGRTFWRKETFWNGMGWEGRGSMNGMQRKKDRTEWNRKRTEREQKRIERGQKRTEEADSRPTFEANHPSTSTLPCLPNHPPSTLPASHRSRSR